MVVMEKMCDITTVHSWNFNLTVSKNNLVLVSCSALTFMPMRRSQCPVIVYIVYKLIKVM